MTTDDAIRCTFCDASVPDAEAAIAADWIPSFQAPDFPTGVICSHDDCPVCPACQAAHLDVIDGEPTTKPGHEIYLYPERN